MTWQWIIAVSVVCVTQLACVTVWAAVRIAQAKGTGRG